MKRLVLLIALATVLSLSSGVLAYTANGPLESGFDKLPPGHDVTGAPLTGNIDVSINLLHYAELEIGGEETGAAIDIGDINFGLGFGQRWSYVPILIRTNDDVLVGMKSDGFSDANGTKNSLLTSLIDYYFPGYSVSANSFGAGGWKTKKFEWDYDKDNPGMIRMQLEARFLRSRTDQDKAEEIWHLIRSGQYTDTVTITISSAK